MSTEKPSDDAAPAAGLEEEDAAKEVMRIVEAVLGAAAGASERPGVAVSALFVAAKALARAIQDDGILPESEIDKAKAFATTLVRGPAMEGFVAMARAEIKHRSVRALAGAEQIAKTVGEATQLLRALQRAGNKHPITQLVILHTAHRFAHALLQHSDPDNYPQNRLIVRAMENAMRPYQVDVVNLDDVEPDPSMMHMSKGGDA